MSKKVKKEKLKKLADRLESGSHTLYFQNQEIKLRKTSRNSGGQGLIYGNKKIVVKITPISSLPQKLNEGLERIALFPSKRNKSGVFIFREDGSDSYCPLNYSEMNSFENSVAEDDIGGRCSDLEQSVNVLEQDFYVFTDKEGSEVLALTYLELIPEPTLDDLLKEEISQKTALTIIANIGDALTELKHRGYVHRDIKPSNIMVKPKTGKITIIDFGLAKDINREKTETESICGTLPYMPPESAIGKLHQNSDIYSLGVIAYQLLKGEFPFSGEENHTLGFATYLCQIYKNETAAWDTFQKIKRNLIESECPEDLAESIAAAMFGNPEQRGTDLPQIARKYLQEADSFTIQKEDKKESQRTIQISPKTEEDLTARITTDEHLTVKEDEISNNFIDPKIKNC